MVEDNQGMLLGTDEAEKSEELQSLDKECRQVLGVDESQKIAYTDLYDSLTARKFHGKGWPKGMTESLYRKIEDEALR